MQALFSRKEDKSDKEMPLHVNGLAFLPYTPMENGRDVHIYQQGNITGYFISWEQSVCDAIE